MLIFVNYRMWLTHLLITKCDGIELSPKMIVTLGDSQVNTITNHHYIPFVTWDKHVFFIGKFLDIDHKMFDLIVGAILIAFVMVL